MFSGKTSQLIELYNKEKSITNNKKILAINYDKDTRYNVNEITSHDGETVKCISINNLSELKETVVFWSKLEQAEYIFINEAQFFKGLKEWVLFQIEHYNKNIILCGLDSDFKREKFGEILDLIPHANTISKLSGLCSKCHNPSIYTHRISNETDQEVIGINNYTPVCRTCYLYLNSSKNTDVKNENYTLAYHS